MSCRRGPDGRRTPAQTVRSQHNQLTFTFFADACWLLLLLAARRGCCQNRARLQLELGPGREEGPGMLGSPLPAECCVVHRGPALAGHFVRDQWRPEPGSSHLEKCVLCDGGWLGMRVRDEKQPRTILFASRRVAGAGAGLAV